MTVLLPVPRPYQERNTAEILACLQRGVRGTIYALPTAGGKTVVSSGVIRVMTEVAERRSVMLVHRRELLRQSVRTLAAVGVEAGIVDPDHDPDPGRLVHVASIDCLKARKRRLADWLTGVGIVVIDEAHHTIAPGWSDLLTGWMPDAQRLGLTATPFRGDGKPLGSIFDAAVRGPSVKTLITDGWLCPPEVWSPFANLDLSGVKVSRGDYVQAELGRVMDDDAITAEAVRQYALRMPGEPAIAFCVSVDHARHVAEAFASPGWVAKSVDGGMDETERDAAIMGLAEGRVQVLTSCEIVSEGTDIPVVSGALLLRPTKSTQKMMQQVGRVLRIHPGKERSVIIDLADNIRVHGMPEADRDWSLDEGLSPVVPRTFRCPNCTRRFEAAPVCPECGRTFHKAFAAADGKQLSLLADSMIRVTHVDRLERMARTRADLERIQRVRGFRPGWVHYAAQRTGITR